MDLARSVADLERESDQRPGPGLQPDVVRDSGLRRETRTAEQPEQGLRVQ